MCLYLKCGGGSEVLKFIFLHHSYMLNAHNISKKMYLVDTHLWGEFRLMCIGQNVKRWREVDYESTGMSLKWEFSNKTSYFWVIREDLMEKLILCGKYLRAEWTRSAITECIVWLWQTRGKKPLSWVALNGKMLVKWLLYSAF